MVRINSKAIDDFLAKAQDTLQNSLIETGYSFTYRTATTNYTLPGFEIGNPRIYSIESIEGTGFLPEDYIISGDGDLIEGDINLGYDYELWDNYTSPEIVPDGYGISSGSQVYTGITIANQTFKDNSIVYIKYKYQNTNYVPILTNFSSNSILRMILTATLLNLQETNEELTRSIDTFGLSATGDDLDRIASLVGLNRDSATFTTGQIKLINNNAISSYSVNTSHRFAAASGSSFLSFVPVSGVTVPASGGEVYLDVIAEQPGSYYNVGSNSISFGFSNSDLTTRVPTTLLVSNPPLGDVGQQNLFNGGQDEETDVDFRRRISTAFSQAKTSSYSTIENAVIETKLADFVRVYDIDLKKDLLENTVETFVAKKSGTKLSSSSLSQILDAIQSVKPTGSLPTLRQTLNNFISFNLNIYVDKDTLGDTTNLETELTDLIDEFINNKDIGEDVLPSSIVSIAKGVTEVLDVEINSHTMTEFASEAPSYDSSVSLATAGTADNWVALEVPFNSATNFVYDTESNITGNNYETDVYNEPYPIDTRTQPRVSIGVVGYDGSIRPSPLDRTNYINGSATRTDIPYDPTIVTGDGITTTDLVLFNYNYFDNTLINGFRIRLGGDSGNQISLDFGYGSDPDNFTSIITPVVVELDGTEKLYDFAFSSQLDVDNYPTYSPDSSNFWLIIKDNEVGSGDSYIPIDSLQSSLAYSPAMYIDDDAAGGGTFSDVSQQRANWHSYTTKTAANAYQKIIIPSQTDEPEKPISYEHTFNFSLFVEE